MARRRAQQTSWYAQEELSYVIDALPQARLRVNTEEAKEIAISIIRQAVEDLRAAPVSLDPPAGLGESDRKTWLRQTRSVAERTEADREDAREFFQSRWFEAICDALDVDHIKVWERIESGEES